MPSNDAAADVGIRVETLARDTDLSWVVSALAAHRSEILGKWLEAAAKQPFHLGRRDSAVSDHIPQLFDALISLLHRDAPRWVDSTAPLDDPAVLAAAESHARARSDEELLPADILTEFRLLRQEIWRALRAHLTDDVPIRDVLGAEALVNDALDGVLAVGLRALTERTESVREDFLATTVHEVRQPITVIRVAAQHAARLLGRPNPDVPLVTEQLKQIQTTADRMADLLLMLVETSRAALGKLDLRTDAADLLAIVRGVVGRLGSAEAQRIRIQAPDALDATGRWDQARLEQVIGNLLSNALKYSPSGAPIDLTVSADSDSVRVTVQDRGVGIDPDDLPGLFQRYTRARSAVERGIVGIGLGLYLCRAVVEGHGGRIWVESPGRDQGTTVYVVLPRRPANASAA